MAELLIVVAITAVLGSLAVVNLVQLRRNMAKLEYDGYAKELFIASQNHLSMIATQGYLGKKTAGLGTKETAIEGLSDTGDGVYYYVIQNEAGAGNSLGDTAEIISSILPFGAVDETVRAGGDYIIRYHKDSAQILDVFYWSAKGNYKHQWNSADYAAWMNLREDKDALTNYNGAVIGYYGGQDAKGLTHGKALTKPELTVTNSDQLYVTVKNPNADNPNAQVKLLLTGKTSGNQRELRLDASAALHSHVYYAAPIAQYIVLLDDVTHPETHFATLWAQETETQGALIPGEDIEIRAVAYNNRQLSNVVWSATRITNSLFDTIAIEEEEEEEPDPLLSVPEEKEETAQATIRSIRHLENLETKISGVNQGTRLKMTSAVQETDLDWEEFQENIEKTENEFKQISGDYHDLVGIYDLYGDSSLVEGKGYFMPVTLGDVKTYNGQDAKGNVHSLSHIRIDQTGKTGGSAGVFAMLEEGQEVKNLILANPQVAGTDAGALAGAGQNAAITNVIAIDLGAEETTADAEATTVRIFGTANAGGLIGRAEECNIRKCAASLIVESAAGNAGGFAGSITGGVIKESYSGGHTTQGAYRTDRYNVTGAVSAGGFAGTITGADLRSCYSTCSARGTGITPTGGMIGAGSGQIRQCYATGKVSSAEGGEGPFAGALFDGTMQDCLYFGCSNERPSEEGYTILEDANQDRIRRFDLNRTALTAQYQEGSRAVTYDPALEEFFHDLYQWQPVSSLAGANSETEEGDLVRVHYGDWPAPDLWVFNR